MPGIKYTPQRGSRLLVTFEMWCVAVLKSWSDSQHRGFGNYLPKRNTSCGTQRPCPSNPKRALQYHSETNRDSDQTFSHVSWKYVSMNAHPINHQNKLPLRGVGPSIIVIFSASSSFEFHNTSGLVTAIPQNCLGSTNCQLTSLILKNQHQSVRLLARLFRYSSSEITMTDGRGPLHFRQLQARA